MHVHLFICLFIYFLHVHLFKQTLSTHVVSVCDFHYLVCVVTIESLICFFKKVTGMSSAEIPQEACVLVTSLQAFLLLYVLASLVCTRRTQRAWFRYEIHGALCSK